MKNFTCPPIILSLLTTILLFGILYYGDQSDKKILLAGAIVAILTLLVYCAIIFFKWGDRYIFLIVSMLVTLGIAMIYRLDSTLGFKQIVWYIAGIVSFIAMYLLFRYVKIWHRLQRWYFLASVMLFMATQIFGRTISGAKNWIIIGGYSFQPSEFIKVLLILFLSCYFSKPLEGKFKFVKEKYVVLGVIYIYCGFLLLQREWGSMVLFFGIYIFLLFIYKNDWHLLFGNLALISVVGYLGVTRLWHIQLRVANWLDPWADPANKGYQITQSLFAIAAGNFFGTGIGLGKPQYIPEVYSDFIFSAVCEEMGMFGGMAVILLFFILIYRGFKISLLLEGFNKCLALGVTILFGIQVFIIIGGVVKLIPLTGITLPFISYGGSSLLASFALLGVLQAVSTEQTSDALN